MILIPFTMRPQCLAVLLLSQAIGTSAQSSSTVGAYGQCEFSTSAKAQSQPFLSVFTKFIYFLGGGSGYVGPTACVTGYTCTTSNPYYYQCVPGTAAPSPTPTSTQTTTPTTAPLTTATGSPTTLQSGWYWIRAVESPYFHSYLQTKPNAAAAATATATAVLDSASTAGQFNIISGQLVYNNFGSSSSSSWYMWVENPTNKTQRALRTWFNATAANPYGSFAFSGDTVTWTDPDVARPNTAAFYVCQDADGAENGLFVNTGPYLYQTPAGCYDVDVSLNIKVLVK